MKKYIPILLLSLIFCGCGKPGPVEIVSEDTMNIPAVTVGSNDLEEPEPVHETDFPSDASLCVGEKVSIKGVYTTDINPVTGKLGDVITFMDKEGIPTALFFVRKEDFDVPKPFSETHNEELSQITVTGTLVMVDEYVVGIMLIEDAETVF